jgi:hypothetical protein
VRYARVIQFRTRGGYALTRGANETLEQSIIGHGLDDHGLHLWIDVYTDEQSARAAMTLPGVSVESDQIFRLPFPIQSHDFSRFDPPARKLGHALSSRLAPHFPQRALEGALGQHFVPVLRGNLAEEGSISPEAMAAVAESLLYNLQLARGTADETVDAWARIDGDTLRLGYGTPAAPVLEFDAIPLSELAL